MFLVDSEKSVLIGQSTSSRSGVELVPKGASEVSLAVRLGFLGCNGVTSQPLTAYVFGGKLVLSHIIDIFLKKVN